jgi:pimeloyl-ACP methyl ester carboxylesterase
MPEYQRAATTIHYEEAGSGFPVLLFGPGGMNSTIEAWDRLEHFDPMSLYKNDVHLISMDQRNAGESKGPMPSERPWEEYYEDQAGLLNSLGVEQCILMGCCIGCSYILKFIEVAPQRVRAAVLLQPIGRTPDAPEGMANHALSWGKGLMEGRSDFDEKTVEKFADNMWRGRDFVFSVSRDFVKSCATPMLVLPGNDRAHPHEIGVEVADLAPNAEMVDPWKEPPEVHARALERVRDFLRRHGS